MPHPFFARFFPGEEDDAYLAYHRLLSARLPVQGRVLDLGCGDHQMLARYRSADREIWGTDFQRHPRLTTPDWFRQLPATGTIPFPDSAFDVVACSWVLEHVAAPQQFLAEVRRVLRPGGWFIALTINGTHYATWIRRAFAWLPHRVAQRVVFRLYRRPDEDTFPTCYRLNTTRQLERASRQTGLELAQVQRVANQGYFAFSRPLWRLAVVADRYLDRIHPALGRIYFVAVWRKPAAAAATAIPAFREAA
jgi:SAM-dependent methyltransferase